MNYRKTVSQIEIDRFMGKWYVIAGRFSFLEKGAHNASESYTWNKAKERIDIDFYFNKNSFTGKVKRIPQKAWIIDKESNAYWKVSPFWPLRLDYLIIAIADDYSWSAVGVPGGSYLWIMARDWKLPPEKVDEILLELRGNGYPTQDIKYIPHQW